MLLTVASVRPVRRAARLRAPLWAGLGERDVTVSRRAVEALAARAPRGELHRYPYDHFGAFVGDGPERVAADQVDFLRRSELLGGKSAGTQGGWLFAKGPNAPHSMTMQLSETCW